MSKNLDKTNFAVIQSEQINVNFSVMKHIEKKLSDQYKIITKPPVCFTKGAFGPDLLLYDEKDAQLFLLPPSSA